MNWDGEITLRTLFSRLLFFWMHTEMKYITIKTGLYQVKTRNFDGKTRRRGAQISLIHYLDVFVPTRKYLLYPSQDRKWNLSRKTFPAVPKWIVNLGASYHVTEQFHINMMYIINRRLMLTTILKMNFQKKILTQHGTFIFPTVFQKWNGNL